jgi:large subunit ribosomal protein L25
MEAILEALKREATGKNDARRLRRAGRIPGVVYGAVSRAKASDATPVTVDPKALLKILHSESGANTLISLTLDGGETRVIVKEFQLDPVSHQLLHADFYRVAMDRAITVTVPVQLKGEPRGVKQQAGLLDFVLREIEIECLPGDIPEHITIDVSELLIGQGVRVRDLAEDARWKPVSDVEAMVVHVIAPKGEEEPAAAEVEVAAGIEPEVIKKGRTEKEGES